MSAAFPTAPVACDLPSTWWMAALRGLLAGTFGVLALTAPFAALEALVVLFAAYSLADGAIRLFTALQRAARGGRWGAAAVSGAAGVAAGVVVLALPGPAGAGLGLFAWGAIAAWALVQGILELAAARRHRRELGRLSMLTLGGLLSLALGGWMLATLVTRPQDSLPILGAAIGLFALAQAALLLTLAIRLRRLERGLAQGA